MVFGSLPGYAGSGLEGMRSGRPLAIAVLKLDEPRQDVDGAIQPEARGPCLLRGEARFLRQAHFSSLIMSPTSLPFHVRVARYH